MHILLCKLWPVWPSIITWIILIQKTMEELKWGQDYPQAATLAIKVSGIDSLEWCRWMSVNAFVTSRFALLLENSVQERPKQKQTNRSVQSSLMITTHLSSSLVATSSNISNHSGVRPSRTPQPTTKTVNPSSFRILSSSLNSSCHIWHALQFIPPVPTSNL